MRNLWLRNNQRFYNDLFDFLPYFSCFLLNIALSDSAPEPSGDPPFVEAPVEVLILLVQRVVGQVLELVGRVSRSTVVFLTGQPDEPVLE